MKEQIDDNQKSIEHSLRQKTEIYFQPKPQISGANPDSNEHNTPPWRKNLTRGSKKEDENESDFIPIGLLNYGILFNKPEDIDNEVRDERYFSSRSYGYTINVCSPKKP